MEQISEHRNSGFEEAVFEESAKKKKFAKSFINNAGIVLSVFIVFVVVVLVTTDISLTSFEEVAALGLDFFLLLFCSYTAYVNCSDSGMRRGLAHETYEESIKRFNEKKHTIITNRYQTRLHEFCQHFIAEELKNARMAVLSIVGFDYNGYTESYVNRDDKDILDDESLSKAQKTAILKANAIKPVHLTPEMILKRGRGSSRRAPLGMKPETKKGINFSAKFVSTILMSLAMTLIVFDLVLEPTWVLFASCIVKLFAVIINGFSGYKFGFENIVFDTVHFVDDQTDLMDQALQYFADNPEKEKEVG